MYHGLGPFWAFIVPSFVLISNMASMCQALLYTEDTKEIKTGTVGAFTSDSRIYVKRWQLLLKRNRERAVGSREKDGGE